MARWIRRQPPPLEIPRWVFDPVFAAEAETWLDELRARDPVAAEEAFVRLLSTPVRADGTPYG